MTHEEPAPHTSDAADETERALADVTREGERVGVDWDVVAAALLSAHPELVADDAAAESHEDPADAAPVLGIDVDLLLPILRGLADGAGTEAFLDALERSGPDASPPAA